MKLQTWKLMGVLISMVSIVMGFVTFLQTLGECNKDDNICYMTGVILIVCLMGSAMIILKMVGCKIK